MVRGSLTDCRPPMNEQKARRKIQKNPRVAARDGPQKPKSPRRPVRPFQGRALPVSYLASVEKCSSYFFADQIHEPDIGGQRRAENKIAPPTSPAFSGRK